MSDVNEQLVNAGEYLMDNVYIPAFIKQCEARGVTFDSVDDLQAAIQNVAHIKQAEASNVASSPSIHKVAQSLLSGEQPQEQNEEAKFYNFLNNINVDEDAVKAAALLSQAEGQSK